MNASESPVTDIVPIAAGGWRRQRTLAGRIMVCVLAFACLGLWQSNVRLRQKIAIEKCTGVVKFLAGLPDLPRWMAPLKPYLGADWLPFFQSPSFVKLNIHEAMSDADVAFIAELPSNVTELDIHNSQITDSTLEKMTAWSRITSLRITSCPNITDQGLRAFAKCPLELVDLRGTAATHKGLFALNLDKVSCLVVDFHLLDNATPADWSRLGSVIELTADYDDRHDDHPRWTFLRGFTNLEMLDVRVELTNKALDELIGLPKLSSLTARNVSEIAFERIMGELDAAYLFLEGDFVGARPERIANSRAKKLYLRSKSLSDDALTGIAQLQKLEHLNIRAPMVTSKGIARLAGANLVELCLDEVKMTDRDVAVFTKMPRLRKLDLLSTDVTVEGRNELYTALPNLQLDWSRR